MNAVATSLLLQRLVYLAERGEDLATGLQARGSAGADDIARSLQSGQDLATACQGVIPSDLAKVLAGPQPPLAQAALLAADLHDMRDQRRRDQMRLLAYPLINVVAVLCLVLWLAFMDIAAIPWLVVVAALAVALLTPTLVLWLQGYQGGVLSAWTRHARQAEHWRQAQAIAQWRLPEAQAQRLFPAAATACLQGIGAVNGAEQYCTSRAQYHRDAAQRSGRLLMVAVTLIIQICAAIIAISVVSRIWTDIYIAFV